MKRKQWIYWRMKSNDTRWDNGFYDYWNDYSSEDFFWCNVSHSSTNLKNASALSPLTSTGRNWSLLGRGEDKEQRGFEKSYGGRYPFLVLKWLYRLFRIIKDAVKGRRGGWWLSYLLATIRMRSSAEVILDSEDCLLRLLFCGMTNWN